MWYSFDFSILTINQEFITEPEPLIFYLVIVFITIAFSFILKVFLVIQNEKIIHQKTMSDYHKLLIASRREIVKESSIEVDFNKKQAVFFNKIIEIKNQCMSLRLHLKSLQKN